ncbi:MAG TPA: ABC transporter permease, partial [Prolixibacteraceae bacterium]
TPKPLGLAIKKDYPEVEDIVRINEYAANFLLTAGEKHFILHGVFADSGLLKIFSLPLLEGNAATALNSLNSIVITKQLAVKLFGKEDAMGKTVRVDATDMFTVTAVLKDLPPNTRFNFEYILPWSYAAKKSLDDNDWSSNSVLTFILLKPSASQALFDEKIKNITINHTRDGAEKSTTEVFTQPLKDNWLYDKQENGKYVGGRIERVKLFGIIAALILIIACINFMNLSTARSESRGKEVGIRKVIGAQKQSLIAQFMAESILFAIVAGILSVIVVLLVLPAYNKLIGINLFFDFKNPYYWLFALFFILLTGLLAGLYPAFYLSSIKSIKALKGTFKLSGSVVTPRKVLVVIQFTFAIILIISTIIVGEQIKYAQNRDAGYSRNNLAFIVEFGDAHKNYELIKRGLLESGAATDVAQTSAPMTESWGDSWGFSWQGSTESDKKTDFYMFSADDDFVTTMKAKIVQGRGIDVNQYKTDSTACLLNEAAVKVMRLKNPVGQVIRNGNDKLHV